MKKFVKKYLLYISLTFIATSCPTTENQDPIQGTIVDEQGNPVDSVQITYLSINYSDKEKKSAYTNAKGEYYIEKVYPYSYTEEKNCSSNEYRYRNGLRSFDLQIVKRAFDSLIVFIVNDSSEVENLRRNYYDINEKYRDTILSLEKYDFGSEKSTRSMPTLVVYKNKQ